MLGNQRVNRGFGKSASRKELMRGMDDALAGKIPTAEQREAVQQFSRANREALVASNAKAAPPAPTDQVTLRYRSSLAGDGGAGPPRRRHPLIRSR